MVIDESLTKANLSKDTDETVGWITSKNMYHSKTGYRYYFKYNFTLNEKEYEKKWLFGIFNTSTAVTHKEYDTYDVGSDVKVIFARQVPTINKLKDIGNEKSYLIWEIAGILIFSVIGINEIKNQKRKRSA